MIDHQHHYEETYYGWRCRVEGCDSFFPYGGAPWEDDDDDAKSHGLGLSNRMEKTATLIRRHLEAFDVKS